MFLGTHVLFDKCSKCASPRVVPAFTNDDVRVVPKATCHCFDENGGEPDKADRHHASKAEAFDEASVDGHVAIASQRDKALTTAEAVLLIGARLGDVNEALLRGSQRLLLDRLAKLAAAVRYAAVDTADLDDAYELDGEDGDGSGEVCDCDEDADEYNQDDEDQ